MVIRNTPLGFCIIGAPKSGTSSMFRWLDEHPSLCGSSPKETFFLMDEKHPLCGRYGASLVHDGTDAYRRFWPPTQGNVIRFEGTTHYYYQLTALDYLAAAESKPFVVILLREPSSRLLSSFNFTRDTLGNSDPRLSFTAYIKMLLDGKLDQLDPYYFSSSSLYVAKLELELGKYAQWLDRWRERIGIGRLRIILFEEMVQQPRVVMKELCECLGVDSSIYEDFAFFAGNQTYPVRYHKLHRMARCAGMKMPAGKVKKWVKSKYLQWQGKPHDMAQDFDDGLQLARSFFEPWSQQLAASYNLELVKWWGITSSKTLSDFNHSSANCP